MINKILDFVKDNWAIIVVVATAFTGLIAALANLSNIIDLFDKLKKISEEKKIKRSTKIATDTKLPSSKKGNGRIINNLPPRGNFVGRQKTIQELIALIKNNRLVVIDGVGGIGKTSLALQIVYHFVGLMKNNLSTFDAVIWTSARDTNLTINHVLDVIARTMEYPYILQLNEAEKYQEVLSLFQKQKILLIVDNYETIQDPLMDKFINSITMPNRILITTRYRGELSSDQVSFHIEKLDLAEGISLIRQEMKQRFNMIVPDSQNDDLIVLYEATGGLPLAIKWAIGQIGYRARSLASISNVLCEAQGVVFETIFARSWGLLKSSSKKVLHSMLFFATTVSRKALFSASGLNTLDFDEALGQLIELSLLDSNQEISEGKKRFNLHPLTRSFVNKEVSEDEQQDLVYYLNIAYYYIDFCGERCKRQNGIDGYDEIDFELPNILKVIKFLSIKVEGNIEICKIISDFSNAINVFLWCRGYWSDRIDICLTAMKCAELLGDWIQAGRQASFIGIVYFWQGNYDESMKWANQSKKYFRHTNSDIDKKLSVRLFGLISMGKGDYEAATKKLQIVLSTISNAGYDEKEKIAIFSDWVAPSKEGYKSGIVSIMQELGIAFNRKKEYETALIWLKQSIELATSILDEEGLAVSYSHLGHTYFGLNKLKEAKQNYDLGLTLAQKVQRKSTMARCHQGLAKIERLRKRKHDAVKHCTEAIDLFDRLGMAEEREELKTLFI